MRWLHKRHAQLGRMATPCPRNKRAPVGTAPTAGAQSSGMQAQGARVFMCSAPPRACGTPPLREQASNTTGRAHPQTYMLPARPVHRFRSVRATQAPQVDQPVVSQVQASATAQRRQGCRGASSPGQRDTRKTPQPRPRKRLCVRCKPKHHHNNECTMSHRRSRTHGRTGVPHQQQPPPPNAALATHRRPAAGMWLWQAARMSWRSLGGRAARAGVVGWCGGWARAAHLWAGGWGNGGSCVCHEQRTGGAGNVRVNGVSMQQAVGQSCARTAAPHPLRAARVIGTRARVGVYVRQAQCLAARCCDHGVRTPTWDSLRALARQGRPSVRSISSWNVPRRAAGGGCAPSSCTGGAAQGTPNRTHDFIMLACVQGVTSGRCYAPGSASPRIQHPIGEEDRVGRGGPIRPRHALTRPPVRR
jgi:hypothetical protein